MGRSGSSGGDIREAIALAQRATLLAPDQVAYKTTLATIYLSAGMKKEAKRELERAATTAANDPTVKSMLNRLSRGG